MSLYEGLFGATKKFGLFGDAPEHFRVRPFAEHVLSDRPEMHPASSDVGINEYWDDATSAPTSDHTGDNGYPVATPSILPEKQGHELQRAECAHALKSEEPRANVEATTWNDSYDRSLDNIQDHVHAVAGAVAMLDAVEHKMIAIKCELQRIRDEGLIIDGEKVFGALKSLSNYVNDAIDSVDDQCVNMLRDAKLEIRFAELEDRGGQPDGVNLTMISIERLLDYKIKRALAEGIVSDETPEFVDDICSIVSSNIQVLTSIMLALFASRDYTQAVTRLAKREGIIPSIGQQETAQLPSATIDRLQFDRIDQLAGRGDQLQEGRASLAELLDSVRESRNDVNAPVR